MIVCALRSLLRWLHVTGTVPGSLSAAVPSVAGWRLSGLPKGLDPGQLRRLLAGCDRRTPTGEQVGHRTREEGVVPDDHGRPSFWIDAVVVEHRLQAGSVGPGLLIRSRGLLQAPTRHG